MEELEYRGKLIHFEEATVMESSRPDADVITVIPQAIFFAFGVKYCHRDPRSLQQQAFMYTDKAYPERGDSPAEVAAKARQGIWLEPGNYSVINPKKTQE